MDRKEYKRQWYKANKDKAKLYRQNTLRRRALKQIMSDTALGDLAFTIPYDVFKEALSNAKIRNELVEFGRQYKQKKLGSYVFNDALNEDEKRIVGEIVNATINHCK